MLTNRYWTTLALVALAAVGYAATPEQVGFYTGKLSLTANELGFKSKSKAILFLQIGADNSTTVTINGVEQTSGGGLYGPTEGVFAWVSPASGDVAQTHITSAHFKKTSIKGKVTGTEINSETFSLLRNFQGTIKLKKL